MIFSLSAVGPSRKIDSLGVVCDQLIIHTHYRVQPTFILLLFSLQLKNSFIFLTIIFKTDNLIGPKNAKNPEIMKS